MVPKNRELRSITGALCKRCLNREDPLQTFTAAFAKVLPGVEITPVQ